jgi:hypothetical protein
MFSVADLLKSTLQFASLSKPSPTGLQESGKLHRYKVALTDVALIGIIVVSIAGVTYQLLH